MLNNFTFLNSLPQPKMSNSDLTRLIRSDEVQRVLKVKTHERKRRVLKRNPLRNNRTLFKLNPFARVQKRAALKRTLGLVKVNISFNNYLTKKKMMISKT